MTLAATLLHRALTPLVTHAPVHIDLSSGETVRVGPPTEDPVIARLTDEAAAWALLRNPGLQSGELFTAGRLLMVKGSVYDLLCRMRVDGRASSRRPPSALGRLRARLMAWRRMSDDAAAQSEAARHDQIGDAFYGLFLGPDWSFSSAYFDTPAQSLADAQRAQDRHIAAKLMVEPRHRVLDIGSGWGGLAVYIAKAAGAASVLGVTLSYRQLARATVRARTEGLADRVSFRLADCHSAEGVFDRIVSVASFQHPGLGGEAAFFRACRARLAPDGLMLLQTTGHAQGGGRDDPWLAKHVWPGGRAPSLAAIVRSAERAGLTVTDVEQQRDHPARTLRAWREAFMARREDVATLFDERFCRMWEYHLSALEAAFRHGPLVVYQLQLAPRPDAAPPTRETVRGEEESLRLLEAIADDPEVRARWGRLKYPRPVP